MEKGQFIIIHRESGVAINKGQGIYNYYASAKKGLGYWIPKERQFQYEIVPLDRSLMARMAESQKKIREEGSVF